MNLRTAVPTKSLMQKARATTAVYQQRFHQPFTRDKVARVESPRPSPTAVSLYSPPLASTSRLPNLTIASHPTTVPIVRTRLVPVRPVGPPKQQASPSNSLERKRPHSPDKDPTPNLVKRKCIVPRSIPSPALTTARTSGSSLFLSKRR